MNRLEQHVVFGKQLRRSRRRRCRDIGRKICQRTIAIVADRGDYGVRRCSDRSHHLLAAKREKLLIAPAAANDSDYVDVEASGARYRTRNLRSRLWTLHRTWNEKNPNVGSVLRQNGTEIACTLGAHRRHERNAKRIPR